MGTMPPRFGRDLAIAAAVAIVLAGIALYGAVRLVLDVIALLS